MVNIKSIKILAGTLFLTLIGTGLHFLYDLTGGNALTVWFSGVNESTFEHLKLFYWASVLLLFAELIIAKKTAAVPMGNFFTLRLNGMLLGMLFIVVFFYTYQGITGRNYDFLNIIDYVLGALLSRMWVDLRPEKRSSFEGLAVAVFGAIGILFLVFTLSPPHIGLFRDPVGGEYGIL